jgi:hypothetical protein
VRHVNHGPPSRLHWKLLPAVVEPNRNSVVEGELVVVRRDLSVVLGAGPNALGEALVDRASLPPAVQFEASANRLIWLYTSTQSSIW